MTVTPSAGIDRPSPRDIRRVVWSSFLGTALEWYDFFLFGTTAAIVFAPLFFPQGNPAAMTLQSFLVFAVGFVARPIGAVVFGHFGDKLGRKGTLMTTLMIMGGATTLMGVLPEYHQAGIIAPVLLTVLRFTQGLATGGEWGGATLMALEFAPEEKRGMYASVVQMGSPVGNLLSTGAVTLFMVLAGDDFLAWGWRIPYLLSIVLIGVGLWMRVGLKESPEFEKIVEAHEVDKVPFFDLMGNAWQRVIVATMCYLFGIAGFFMMGLPRLRELIVEVMRLEGIEADPDDIIVTAGSQLALEVLSKVMLDPGDVVIAEGPSYAGGLAVLATYEADLRHTEIDEHGLVPERLAEQIATVEAEGKRVKMVYSIPTFQNPANTVLPPER